MQRHFGSGLHKGDNSIFVLFFVTLLLLPVTSDFCTMMD